MSDFIRDRRYVAVGALVTGLVIMLALFLRSAVHPARDAGSVVNEGMKRVMGEVDIRNAFIKVADTVGPAVVSISTERTEKVKVNPFGYQGGGSPFMDEFFNRFFSGHPEEIERKQAGLGSGVIIDKKGYILTNEHVINGADKIIVTLPDGREFEAEVKGSDQRSDLAIIGIKADGLPVAPLGNSDYVQTGEWAVAIGNPFGYIVDSPKPTVTAGVISALHRSLPSPKSGYMDLIQTDAAINPGNSGGPLCDLAGNVIGINVAIFSTSGGYQGVGFAIPINSAKKVIGDLIEGKKITYGWVGVVIQSMTDDLKKHFGITGESGVLISQVIKDSPAEKAGLKAGDIIIEFSGNKIKGAKDLVVNITHIPVGESVKLAVLRDNVKINLSVKIGEAPTEDEASGMKDRGETGEQQAVEKWRGLNVYPISQEMARRFSISQTDGVIVVSVDPGSQAYYASLRRGDIIKKIGTKTINGIEAYKAAIKDAKGDVLIYTDKGFTIIKEGK